MLTTLNLGLRDFKIQLVIGCMQLLILHDRIIFYLLIILAVVVWFLISSILNTDHMAHLHHGNTLEIFWTVTPAVVLWAIGLPSLR